jgi:ABC-2 type transport system ATP-binding protein
VIVSVENLIHRYGDRAALDGLSLNVPEGVIFGLLGPNGGGKSTLFRILATLMAPTSGTVTVAGHDVVKNADEVRRHIGVVFQTQSLDKKLTVGENLRAQGHLYALSGSELAGRIDDAVTRLGLKERMDDITESLSGGLKRRVEIAKALLHRPEVLLMDEPSTGLDPGARRELADYIKDLRDRRGVTILLTTHILDEAEHCDQLLLLHEGRRVAEGAPAELKARVGGDVVVVEVADPAAVSKELQSRLGVESTVVEGGLRIEIDNGHKFVADVVEAFPGAVESVALHKPTLEDVFLDETGATIS